MPSQRPLLIPKNAIMDPEMCARFGRPVMAIHSQCGAVAPAGGGVVFNKGLAGGRGAASTDYTFDRGAIRKTAGSLNTVDFGRAKLWEPADFVTVWSHHAPTNFAGVPTSFGNTANTALHGYELGINGSGNSRFFCSDGTSKSIVSTATLTNNVIITQMGVAAMGVAWGGLYINGNLQTVTGAATPGVPTYATNMHLCSRPSTSLGAINIYQALIWNKAQPQYLAYLLDRDPDLMWWWPGKTNNKVYFVPAGATTVLFRRSIEPRIGSRGRIIASGGL